MRVRISNQPPVCLGRDVGGGVTDRLHEHRVQVSDVPLLIVQGKRHGYRIDDGAGFCLALAQLARHILRLLERARPCSQLPGQQRQQNTHQDAGQPCRRNPHGFDARFKSGQGAQRDGPGMPVDVDAPGVMEQGLVHTLGSVVIAVEHQRFRRCVFAIENLVVNAAGLFAEYAGHQVIHAKRRIDPSDDVGAAVGQGFMRAAVPVYRQIHEKAGLHLLPCFLHQRDLARQRRFIQIARLLHGGTAHRFRIHVVAKGAQVAAAEGLQKNDGRIESAFALRAQGVAGEAFFADGFDVPDFFVRRDDQRKTDALDARIVILQAQVGHVVTEFTPINIFRRDMQALDAAQDLFIGGQPLLDAQHDLAGVVREPALLKLARGVKDRELDKVSRNEAARQHQPGQQLAGAQICHDMRKAVAGRRQAGSITWLVLRINARLAKQPLWVVCLMGTI